MVDALLNLLPDTIAGLLLNGLEEQSRLLGDVLKVINKSRAVFAGFEVLVQRRILGDAIVSGSKKVRQLLLKFSTRHGTKGIDKVVVFIERHIAASLRLASRTGSGWRRSSRSLSRAL